MNGYDVVVIGGGVAGLTAAIEAGKNGSRVLLFESDRLGGRMNTEICPEFAFNGKISLSGPEVVDILIEEAEKTAVEVKENVFVFALRKKKKFEVDYLSKDGVGSVKCDAVVLATGARDINAKDVFLYGDPSVGVFTAKEVMTYLNAYGVLPTKRSVVWGCSSDGLKVAQMLTLKGVEVEGVYDERPFANASDKDVALCLNDYNIPLCLLHSIVGVKGEERLRFVKVAKSDGTVKTVESDSLILALGKKPLDKLARKVGAKGNEYLDVDQNMSTTIDGLFVCGHAQYDYEDLSHVTESAEIAGLGASSYKVDARFAYATIDHGKGIENVLPRRINLNSDHFSVTCFIRFAEYIEDALLSVKIGDKVLYTQNYHNVKPYCLQRLCLDFSGVQDRDEVVVELE